MRYLVCLLLASLLSACSHTSNIKVKPLDESYTYQSEQTLAKDLSIYLPEETKDYQYKTKISFAGITEYYIFDFGGVLSSEIQSSLNTIAKNVQNLDALKTGDSGRRIIELRFGDKTNFVHGLTAVSDQAATTEILYTIYDDQLNLIKKGSVIGEKIRPVALNRSLLLTGFMNSRFNADLGMIFYESLNTALEKLNAEIVAELN